MNKERIRLNTAKGIQESEKRIDREKGIIYGFSVVEKGVLKDERGEFNEEGLAIVASLGEKSKIGIKSRYGHPNMSNEALGTFLGRVKNFNVDGDIVRGDLHFDKTAYKTPNGDLANYVMDLAESDPDAFGASMVIKAKFVEQLEDNGKPKKDEKGKKAVPLMMVTKLSNVDIVDDGAATKSMLGSSFFSDSVKPSAGMTTFLDKFLDDSDAISKTISFLERYSNNKGNLARGEGQGVGGPKQGDGGTDTCVCPKCGYKSKHEKGTACSEIKCPKCGASMTGEGANNSKKLDNGNKAEYNEKQIKIKGGGTVDTVEALKAQIVTLEAEKAKLAIELEAKKGAEDREVLKTQIATLEEKIKVAEGSKTTITELETKLSDAEAINTKNESDKIALAKSERVIRIDSYIELGKKEGRILPALEVSLKSLIVSLDCEKKDFTAKDKDGKEIKVTQEELLLSVLGDMPKSIKLGEVVVDGDKIVVPNKIQNKENIPVENVELATQATKYAKDNECSYQDALIALTVGK